MNNVMDYALFKKTLERSVEENDIDISLRVMEKLLYEVGFVGGMRITQTSRSDDLLRKNPRYDFKFSFNKPRFNLKTASRLCIHPMFYETLSINPVQNIIVKGH
jgi:hypothetical protein